MSIAVFSTLYPSAAAPVHGIFVRELAAAMATRVPLRVIAPLNALRHPSLAMRGSVSAASSDSGLPVDRPPFATFPRIFKQLDAPLMAAFSERTFRRAVTNGVRLIHAHYAYPDAAAARLLCRKYGIPYIVTLHGSDINVIAQDPRCLPRILDTLREARAVVAVSGELARKTSRLMGGCRPIHHIPNGVDIRRFSPENRESARKRLGISHARVLLTVGRLDPVKAYDQLISALRLLPEDIGLVMAGDGPERSYLERFAAETGTAGRVRFAGAVAHDRLRDYYQAADLTVISSHREGWPTIIFESLACGTPVAAHAVGGIPEILSDPDVGFLFTDNSPDTIARSLTEALNRAWKPDLAIGLARRHTWDAIAGRYLDLLHHLHLQPGARI